MAMERIYADYEDKFVHATLVYAKETDDESYEYILYKDPEYTVGLTKEETNNLFLKGIVIDLGKAYVKPHENTYKFLEYDEDDNDVYIEKPYVMLNMDLNDGNYRKAYSVEYLDELTDDEA